jgi:hypothetical protein
VSLQVPQLTDGPQPLETLPQFWPLGHVGAWHATHVLPLHWVRPAHVAGQESVPLPQALFTVPHFAPPSGSAHSGGSAPHTPPVQTSPVGQLHEMVPPQPVLTVPHSCVCESGVHVMGTHASLTPASLGGGGVTHTLPMHARPPVQEPHLIATPHASVPISPHLPVQSPAPPVVVVHCCICGSPGVGTQTWLVGQPVPQRKTWPLQGSV